MSGIELISSLLLWIVVLLLSLLSIGLLQQLGLLHRRLDEWKPDQADDTIDMSDAQPGAGPPLISEDGPAIGSMLPERILETYKEPMTFTPSDVYEEHDTLVLFMTPFCESCQHLVDPLNQLVDTGIFKGRVLVILRSDITAYRAFLKLYPIHAPVVCDQDFTITKGFGIHRSPFALFYDVQGTLVRKGRILTFEAFLALLGDSSVSPEALASIYPPIESAPPLLVLSE